MTSRPLFISVAESIVILRPICHVGCCSACSGVTRSSCVAREVAKRSARRGENQPPDLAPVTAVQALVDGVVLAVDRENRHAAAARGLRHQRARHDQHFLVGERDRLARFDRREHGLEASGPGRRADHDVDVGMRRHRHQTFGAAGHRRRARPAPHAARSRSTASAVAIATTSGR